MGIGIKGTEYPLKIFPFEASRLKLLVSRECHIGTTKTKTLKKIVLSSSHLSKRVFAVDAHVLTNLTPRGDSLTTEMSKVIRRI
jgi:hypothetical protein